MNEEEMKEGKEMEKARTISRVLSNAMAHKRSVLKRACFLTFMLLVWMNFSHPTPAQAQPVPPTQCANPAGPAPTLNTTGLIGLVEGTEPVLPAAGQGGFLEDNTFFPNFKPYRCPGQDEDKNGTKLPDSEPFAKSYAASNAQPVQSSDWWTVFGLQKSTTVTSRGDNLSRTRRVVSEPMTFDFIDFNRPDLFPNMDSPVGVRLWSQNSISVRCDGKQTDVPTPCNQQPPADTFNPKNVSAGTGNIVEDQPVVTVGLKGVHPLGLTAPTSAPWTNVVVKRYTDWGVLLSYANSGSELTINAFDGSPFAWFGRQGAAPFEVWVGGSKAGQGGVEKVWLNAGGVIGLTIRTEYVPFKGLPNADSTASYLIYANKGTWSIKSTGNPALQIQYENTLASLVVVMAVPHNLTTTAELLAAKETFLPFACRAIVNTLFDYPPNQPATPLVPLGYDAASATVSAQLRVLTTFFGLPGCTNDPNAPALLLLYPHHRKSMIASQKTQEMPQFSWNSLLGKLTAFKGSVLVQQLRTLGVLPFLPSAALNSNLQNPLNTSELASDDIYRTAKTWFYLEEPIPCPKAPCPHLNSFVRNLALYDNVGTNSYIPGTTTLREGLVLADQFSQSKNLTGIDNDLNESKNAVGAEMRGVLLQSLKDLVGEWADVYTAQLFQYNGKFNSIYGYPAGFGAVGNFNDHHFHYGYFLRAAAAIGRYDRAWLDKYLPLIDELRMDVANTSRSNTSRYPFLREFNPYEGHSWANGTGDGGNNEESSSEAINFAVGLIELGDILNRGNWRDLGLYLSESEILTAEQYWFNQDADRTKPVPLTPIGIIYNGNWPEQYVTYVGPDGLPWHVTTVGIFSQFELDRGTFFGGIDSTFAIQQTPLGASDLYLGRNQGWLADNWQQFVRETTIAAKNGQPLSGTNDVIAAAMQARLPDSSGTDIDDTGLVPALKRINRVHNFYEGAENAVGKYFAYTLAQIGQIDASVVANTPEYGVFKKADGVRTFVAYNPSSSPLTVTFKPRNSNTALTTVDVPAGEMVTRTGEGGAQIEDKLTPAAPAPGRLFLHGGLTGGTLPSDCLGTLDGTPGNFTVAEGQTAFPPDLSALNSALAVVPPRSDSKPPPDPPPPADVRCWAGTFSGNLVSEGAKATRMNIFTDKSLFPGWQENHDTAGRALTMRVQYFFDPSHTTPDRVEVFQNVALNIGDAFEFQNKITEFYFDQVFGLNLTPNGPGPNPVLISPNTPFPATVSNGKIIVQIYGGSGTPSPGPVPVAVGWAPLTNRASWIKPPYEAP